MKTVSSLFFGLAALLLASNGPESSVQAYSASFDLLDHTSQLSYYHPANPFYPVDQTALPAKCTVDQLHLVARHMTRYPSTGSYKGLQRFETKVQTVLAQANTTTLAPELEFLRTWKLNTVVTNSATQVENITALGLQEAFDFGQSVRSKYAHLYQPDSTVWSGSVERVQLTAKSFMKGLYGQAAEDNHYANLITSNSSDHNMGANTLTPIDSCTNFPKDISGSYQTAFTATWVPQSLARLEKLWPGFGFISDDLFGMMDLCMYEMNLLGKTQRRFCQVFTDEEWINYEYNKDFGYYYDSGWGNPLARVAGLPYVNAVSKLLAQPRTASCQNIYVAFSHDTQMTVFMAAFGIFADDTWSNTTVSASRRFHSSRAVAMGSRIATERLNCGADGTFVRLTVNDAVVPFEDCKSGPGMSCSLEDYLVRLKGIQTKVGDFMTKCGVPATPGLSSELRLFDSPARNLCSNSC
ncbi:Phosphoglycerate mutase [Globisporangium polare]